MERAEAWYRERHFWPVRVEGDAVLLPLGRGVVAFEVPVDRAVPVQKALERNDIHTPALFVKRPDARVTFLADADDATFGQFEMPSGVRYLTVPVALRLPLLTTMLPCDRSWFRAPDPARRWFPRAASVLSAINAVTPYALRAHRTPWRAAGRDGVLIG
ncbi:hypothetical protein LFM09_44640 [Lentzea alba]|uniref:hypothetical protein n=1 Tax=Lentzea alba TaxID=2714351 RepID=UPI0039BF627D